MAPSWCGRADVPLNATRLAQAEATANRVASDWRPAAIYASPLSRTIRTAEAAARLLGLEVETHLGLVDIDYGHWQGLTPDQVRAQWQMQADARYHQPHLAAIPGGETLDQVRARAIEAVRAASAPIRARRLCW